jgi:hypothetical protein
MRLRLRAWVVDSALAGLGGVVAGILLAVAGQWQRINSSVMRIALTVLLFLVWALALPSIIRFIRGWANELRDDAIARTWRHS